MPSQKYAFKITQEVVANAVGLLICENPAVLLIEQEGLNF